jgi:uncharacterized membrane protein YjgN (DUF898 family)
MTELKDDRFFDSLSRKWLLVVLLSMVPAFLLFAVLGYPGRGRAAAISLAIIMIVVRMRWDLKRHTWFWMTLTVLIALHVVLILLVPWTSRSYPGITLLPIALVDYAIVYGCIRLAEKAMKA